MKATKRYEILVEAAAAGEVLRGKAVAKQGLTLELEAIAKPAMSARDQGKLGVMIDKAHSELGRARIGTSRPVERITNYIDKAQKLMPEAVDGGQDLIDQVIGILWSIYSKVEAIGTADDHYLQSDIPCNEYGAGMLEYKPRERLNGERSHGLPVSPMIRAREMAMAGIASGLSNAELLDYTLDTIQPAQVKRAYQRPVVGQSDQRKHSACYAFLDTLNARQLLTAPKVEAGKATACKASASPMSQGRPWAALTWQPEVADAGKAIADWAGQWQFVYADGTRTTYQF